jgi:hypothetical protein
MSLEQGANLVTNGLILSLDAANVKSYSNVVQYLIVAGGGAGGSHVGGGGGGGGVLQGTTTLTTTSYSIVVGAGGTSTGGDTRGNNGQNSSAFGLTAIGGGGGGTYSGLGNANGILGGSGGGAGGTDGTTTATGGAGTAGQGFAGGSVGQRTGGAGDTSGAGGGGAGQAAASRVNAYDSMRRNGGDGVFSDITGTARFFGGGGGSGSYNARLGGNGGLGGGGGGASTASTGGLGDTNSINNASNGNSGSGSLGGAGAANSGGGGGGGAGGSTPSSTAAGGSGIVVVRYPGAARATGGTISTVGTDTVHTFTSSGTLLFTQANTTYWANLSGTAGNSVLTNGVTYSSANGGSLVFDGTNDVANSTTSIIDRTNGQEITVSCWIRPARNGGQYSVFCTNRSNDASIYNWIFYQHTNDGAISFHGIAQNKSSYIPVLNQWVNVTNTVTTAGVSTLYVNGVSTHVVTGFNYGNGTPSRLGIGANPGGTEAFQGNISQTYIYTRALTAAEVLQNYNSTKARYGL